MARVIKVATPIGEFSRKTANEYTHVNVWASPRAMAAFQNPNKSNYATETKWKKDLGYGVTWHTAEASAVRAGRGTYRWDRSATLVGTFVVPA